MDVSVFRVPNVLIAGRGAAARVGAEAKRLASDSVLIITDPAIAKAGLVDGIRVSLEKEGFRVEVFDQVEADPSLATVDKAVVVLRRGGHRLVVGLGGGSSMDVAKSSAAIAPLEGGVRDYTGLERLPRAGLPRILVATTSGTGSEVTQTAILTDEKTGVKQSIRSVRVLADVAVVDPLLCLSMPRTVTVDTGLDAFVHALEGYVSRTHFPLADVLALDAIRVIADKLPVATFCADDVDAREAMANAATYAGMVCTNAGLGAVHALTYPLTKYGLSHGRSNAVMLPHVMEFNLPAAYDRFAAVGQALRACDAGTSPRRAAAQAMAATRALLEELGVSCRLRDYGIPEDKVESFGEIAMNGAKHLLANNPRKVTLEDVRGIYRRAW